MTFDGVDDILEGSFSKGSAWTTHEFGAVGSRVAFGVAGDTLVMMHQGGGFIGGVRDTSALAWQYTTASVSVSGTTDPDGKLGYYSGSDEPNNLQARFGLTVEGTNLAPSSSAHTDVGLTVAFGGRVATAAYANWATQAFVAGVRLTDAQREYLVALLRYWTGA